MLEFQKNFLHIESFSTCSAPLSSYLYRFDFFEIRHGIGMSAEVDVLPLHVLHLAGKVQIVYIRPMLLCGHADLAAALVHVVDDGVLRFQLVHAVGKYSGENMKSRMWESRTYGSVRGLHVGCKST